MAVAAEQFSPQFDYYEDFVPEFKQPLIFVVPELIEDRFTSAQANRFIGGIAVSAEVIAPIVTAETVSTFESIAGALQAAYEGNPLAREMIAMNVRTDVIERTSKSATITEVPLSINEDDEIMQFGQSFMQVQENTLRYASEHPVMRARHEANTRNAFRLTNLHRQGYMEDYSLVVFERAENLPEAGFFVDTMSVSIQVTTAKDGGLTTESAFVAGIAAPGKPQHDAETIAELGAKLAVDYSGKTPAEIIDTPLLIHNSLLPNGVLNLVAMYDEAAGGTFFGEDKPVQDYIAHREACLARQATFEPRVQKIVDQLIAEAPMLKTPEDASRRLGRLCGASMIERAVTDTNINPQVFGNVAARHIEMGRLHAANGNVGEAEKSIKFAKQNDKSSSCPSSLKTSASSSESQDDTSEKGSGKLEKMTCPFCKDPNQSGDPCSPNQHCRKCNARVVAGKVVSKGNGGTKKAI